MKKGTEIKTWEDICEVLNIDQVASLAKFDTFDEEDKLPQMRFFQLTKLSKALWGEEIPTFTKPTQKKWFPVFWGNNKNEKSGFGFTDSGPYYDRTVTVVGARLSYPSEELSDHAGTVFIEWYRDMMVIKI